MIHEWLQQTLEYLSAVQASLGNPSDRPVVLLALMLIRLCSVWIGRTGTVRVCQQALDGRQYGAYIVARRPGFLNDV